MPPLELKGKLGAVTAYRLLDVLEAAEGVPRRLDAPLVGRERELETLRDEFRRAVEERRCHLVSLVGEPGVGKSRLVRELAAAVESEAIFLQGRCLPYGEGITYWPLAQIVRAATAIDDGDSAAQALEKVATLVGDWLVAEHVGGLLGLTERQPPPGEVPAAVRTLVEKLAAERPLVAVVDDIQWAEATLLELLEYLGARAAAPVLLVCVARPELIEARVGWPGVVRLEPLSSEESALLVRALLHETGLPADTVTRISDAAGGNPLFCEQMVAMLIDEGRIRREGERWVAQSDLSSLGVPAALHALIAARLDSLAPAERTTIARAAVVGEEFSKATVQELLPAELATGIDSLLEALARRELVAPADDDERFAFRHLLIRDVAYQTLTKESRAELHQRVGDWIERTAVGGGAAYDEIVGYHLEQAYKYLVELHAVDDRARRLAARACKLLAEAGRRAHRRGDVDATAGLLIRARGLMATDDRRRPALLIDLADVLGLVRPQEAEAAFTEAAEAAARAGEEGAALIARVSLLRYRVVLEPEAVDLGAALEQGRIALDRFERDGDDVGIARACRLLSQVHLRRGELGHAAAAIEQGIEPALRAGDVFLRHDLPNLVYVLALGAVPTSQALARGLELLELARSDRVTAASVASGLAVAYALRGEFERARALVEPAIVEHEELGHIPGFVVLRSRLATIEALAQNWPAHESAWRQIHESSVATGRRERIVQSAVAIGESLSRQGRLEEAARFAVSAAEEAAVSYPDTHAALLRLQARLHAYEGADDDAERLARDALAAAFEIDSPWVQADTLMDVAEVRELAGRTDEAREAVERALQLYEQKEHLVGVERAGAALSSRVGA